MLVYENIAMLPFIKWLAVVLQMLFLMFRFLPKIKDIIFKTVRLFLTFIFNKNYTNLIYLQTHFGPDKIIEIINSQS